MPVLNLHVPHPPALWCHAMAGICCEMPPNACNPKANRYHAAMKKLPLFVLLAALLSGPVLAEKADANKPMNIEADTLRHDDLKQVSVFTGNVVLTKGSLNLRGSRVDVRTDPQGYQFGTVTAGLGKRALFRQKRDTVPGTPDEFIEGESETIEYDGRADTIKFIKQAELRRYTNNTLFDQIHGDIINYHNLTDVFTVDGNPASASPTNPGGRVRVTLTPHTTEPPAPSAAPTSVPTLRSSSTLNGTTP